MGIFTGAANPAASARIFARLQNGGQWLAYQTRADWTPPCAIVLPLPVAEGTGDDGVEFIDLSDYPNLFDDLDAGFPAPLSPEWTAAVRDIRRVGSFETSYVPRIRDLERVGPRFRLPERVWSGLPAYEGYGFAVFQLREGRHKACTMALRFPSRDPRTLFFPTLHVHNGEVHPHADFDHKLYAQGVGVTWDASEQPAITFADAVRSRGLVEPALPVFRCEIRGPRENRDIVVPGELPAVVSDRGGRRR